jgi:hypothetical protein
MGFQKIPDHLQEKGWVRDHGRVGGGIVREREREKAESNGI